MSAAGVGETGASVAVGTSTSIISFDMCVEGTVGVGLCDISPACCESQTSKSCLRIRHCPRILNAGSSPSCAITYTVFSVNCSTLAISRIVMTGPFTGFLNFISWWESFSTRFYSKVLQLKLGISPFSYSNQFFIAGLSLLWITINAVGR
ncbi:hypothetical protein D3C79_807290 [compost metagenome]